MSKAVKYDIYSVGNALLDTEIKVNDDELIALGIEKGVMTLVDQDKQSALSKRLSDHLVTAKRASGGSAANSIIAASYFGARTFHSCRVANDENGTFYLQDLSAAGVDYHVHNGTRDGITGKCLVMISPDAERSMCTFLGVSETLDKDDIDEQALQLSRFAYIEGYLVTSPSAQPAAVYFRELAEKLGVSTVISLSDPAIVQHFHGQLLDVIGKGVDLLFCNVEEALHFTKTDSLDAASDALKQYTKAFAITLGAEGALLFDGQEHYRITAEKVNAVDTNGAGDMFAGAFLYAICKGEDFTTAGELAVKAAAKVVTQYGPRLRAEQHAELLNQATSLA